MSPRGWRSLRAVRTVRERAEEREERALGEVSREVLRASVTAERLREALAEIRETSAKNVGGLSIGLEIRQIDAVVSMLKQQEAEATEELALAEARRFEQVRRYRGAHAGRKVIEELQGRRRAAHASASVERERKAAEELFSARRTILRRRGEDEVRER